MFTLKQILARRIGKEILVLKLQFREAYVTAAGCGPVILVSTFVWAGVSDRPVYVSGHYSNSVRDGFRILFILGVGTH